MNRFLSLLLMMLLLCNIYAQDYQSYTIYLKNGSEISCYIKDYQFGTKLEAFTLNGSEFYIQESDILEIKKNVSYFEIAEEKAKKEAEAKAKAEQEAKAKAAQSAISKGFLGKAGTAISIPIGNGSGTGHGNLTGNGSGTGSGMEIGSGTALYNLAGRSLVGNLPTPQGTVQEAGKVVVEIVVDKYGTVTNATVTSKGTTVQNKTMWQQAVAAAKKAKFNSDPSAVTVQTGTITYNFKL